MLKIKAFALDALPNKCRVALLCVALLQNAEENNFLLMRKLGVKLILASCGLGKQNEGA